MLGSSLLSDGARPWFKGTVEEIAVRKLLDQLVPPWTVQHAIPVGSHGTDIDHVPIGPGGMFTLNAKNHSGQLFSAIGRMLMIAR